MPYIKQSQRAAVNRFIDALVEEMNEQIDGEAIPSAGLVNYVITRIVAGTLRPPFTGWSYSSLSTALAVFRDAEAEMRRRLLDPYEDKAIAKNGDIPEYEDG